MLITRECDYAIRILRVLVTHGKKNVHEIAQLEDLTDSITYKLARKLEKSGLIKSYRGINGGYDLALPPSEIKLIHVFLSIDKDLLITECVSDNYKCSRNSGGNACKFHYKLLEVQKIIYDELLQKTLDQIF